MGQTQNWKIGDMAWGLYFNELIYGEIVGEIPETDADCAYAEINDITGVFRPGACIPIEDSEIVVDERASDALRARRENYKQYLAGQKRLPGFDALYWQSIVFMGQAGRG